MSTQEQHAAAIKAAIDAVVVAPVYEMDEIPTTRPSEYVEFTVERRFGGSQRLGVWIGTTSYRIATRVVSQKSVSNARLMAEGVRSALEFNSLTVAGGTTTTPVMFESAEPIGPDNEWFSGMTLWTFAS